MVVHCSCKKRRRRRTALCCEGKECVILFIFLWFAVFFQAMGRDDNKKILRASVSSQRTALPHHHHHYHHQTGSDGGPQGPRSNIFAVRERSREVTACESMTARCWFPSHVLLVFWGLFAFFIQAQISSPLCPSEVSSSRVNTGRRHKLRNWSWLVLLNWDTYVRHILLEKQKKNNNNYTPKKFSLIFLQTSNSVSALSALSVVCIH